jgi:hypothetical protein
MKPKRLKEMGTEEISMANNTTDAIDHVKAEFLGKFIQLDACHEPMPGRAPRLVSRRLS